jgi:phenylacetate-CoA ligase
MRRLARTARLLVRARREARFPFAPPEEIARARRRRVRSMVRHAYATVPFWRDAMDGMGARPEDFADAEDLARLPVASATELQARPEDFSSSRYRDEDVLAVRSGGSTAQPKTVRHDSAALLANAAHGERERSIVARVVGRSTGYRESVVASPFSTVMEVQAFVRRHLRLPGRAGIRRRYSSMLADVDEVAGEVAAFRPHVIHGYGSYLGPLLRRMADRDAIPSELRVVTYSSDALAPADRRFIEEAGLRVISTYQAIEAFKIAFECGESEGLHVNADLYPVRIVDDRGRDTSPGEVGSVLVSNLVNRATVLLHYRLGDEAAFLPGRCPCGRTLPRISLPLGREQDWVELADGRRAHPQAVRTLLTDETEIRTYQVVQLAPGRFDLLLVASPGIDRERAALRLAEKFERRFGDPVVRVRWVENLERSASGKIRSVVRR